MNITGLTIYLTVLLKFKKISFLESYLNDSRNDIFATTLSLRDNFPSENGKYSPKQIRKFIELAGFEKIVKKSPIFVKNLLDKKEIASIDAFPSLKMMLLTVFYKFYIDNRRSTTSDAFDIRISALTPYVDAVFTENHQAEVIKKIKNLDSFRTYAVEIRSLTITVSCLFTT